jgi:dienelactone hydrolase
MMARSLLIAILYMFASTAGAPAAPPPGHGPPPHSQGAQGVAHQVLHLVDHSRTAHFRNGTSAPRTLLTFVRYPRSGQGPFPLIVFGHGFNVTPAVYSRLLDAWARAGYVVAAPVFPVESPSAPGGADRSDLVNEPRDISFVITGVLTASANATSPLYGLVDTGNIAVAGQSDGAEAALAVAYDPRFLDARVRAAIILSGAELPGGPRHFPHGGAALLAAQGTADTINPPGMTNSFFRRATRPKFLLWLLGAGHLAPYTAKGPGLTVVERVTTAFLDHYLRDGPLSTLLATGDAPGVARLTADP